MTSTQLGYALLLAWRTACWALYEQQPAPLQLQLQVLQVPLVALHHLHQRYLRCRLRSAGWNNTPLTALQWRCFATWLCAPRLPGPRRWTA